MQRQMNPSVPSFSPLLSTRFSRILLYKRPLQHRGNEDAHEASRPFARVDFLKRWGDSPVRPSLLAYGAGSKGGEKWHKTVRNFKKLAKRRQR